MWAETFTVTLIISSGIYSYGRWIKEWWIFWYFSLSKCPSWERNLGQNDFSFYLDIAAFITVNLQVKLYECVYIRGCINESINTFTSQTCRAVT